MSDQKKCCEKCMCTHHAGWKCGLCHNPRCDCHSTPTTGEGESLLPEKLQKRVITYNGHHYIRVKYVNDYLWFLRKTAAPTTPETPPQTVVPQKVPRIVQTQTLPEGSEASKEVSKSIIPHSEILEDILLAFETKWEDHGDERYGLVKHNNTILQHQIDWLRTALTQLAEKTREEAVEEHKKILEPYFEDKYEQGFEEGAAAERHRISVEVEKALMDSGVLAAAFNLIHEKRHREVTLEDDAVCRCFRSAALTRVQEIINPKQNDV